MNASKPLRFGTRFVDAFPGDQGQGASRRLVRQALYASIQPSPVPAPRVLAYSREVGAMLDLPAGVEHSRQFAEIFGGNRVPEGARPFAARYGGHQFGRWAGQLGDGRAITLGERRGPEGKLWEVQLKGAGPTPFSRSADGRAVLRSSVREFLCSEAMHHLGVPTTRALCLIATGDGVMRDMFYDGHPREEPGAVVCRVARSFLRFGSFEILAANRETELARELLKFCIEQYFDDIDPQDPAAPVALFREVMERTARLVIHWERVGFVHGVLNTDNLSLLGLTIDYGPYGWLEPYDPQWTPNTTDLPGRRYAFGQQPAVCGWNLARLAEALVPLIGAVDPFEEVLARYPELIDQLGRQMRARKLGLGALDQPGDDALISELYEMLSSAEIDYTLFFRGLARLPEEPQASEEQLLRPLQAALYDGSALPARARGMLLGWLRRYRQRLESEPLSSELRRKHMEAVNPRYVLRNYLAQQAIDAAEAGDAGPVRALLDVMRRPYATQPGRERYAARRPEWARDRPGCSTLSCSS